MQFCYYYKALMFKKNDNILLIIIIQKMYLCYQLITCRFDSTYVNKTLLTRMNFVGNMNFQFCPKSRNCIVKNHSDQCK